MVCVINPGLSELAIHEVKAVLETGLEVQDVDSGTSGAYASDDVKAVPWVQLYVIQPVRKRIKKGTKAGARVSG